MLVVSRKKYERVIIGDSIVVAVMRIDGNKVRLGISAPDEIEIQREEVYQRIQKERGCEHGNE